MPDFPHPWPRENMRILPRLKYSVAMLRDVEANILLDPTALDVNDTLMQFMDFGAVTTPSVAQRISIFTLWRRSKQLNQDRFEY